MSTSSQPVHGEVGGLPVKPTLPIYGEVGDLLKGLGTYLKLSPEQNVRRSGEVLEKVGDRMATSDQVADGALEGKSAAEIAGGIAGAVLGAAIPVAVLSSMNGAVALTMFLGISGAPPVVAAVLVVAAGYALSKAGEKIGSALAGYIEDQLKDLLESIFSDPLVLDLDGDGIELVALDGSPATFDFDNDGVIERTGWVSSHDGFLVQDENGNQAVDGIQELFGSAEMDGYDELQPLDVNQDGRVDALDPAFASLLVWRDLNLDGVSAPDELLTLPAAGISHLSTAFSQSDTELNGNIVARTGGYGLLNGTVRSMASIEFKLDQNTGRATLPDNADLSHLTAYQIFPQWPRCRVFVPPCTWTPC